MAKLTHDFFNGDTVAIAQALLGKYLVRNRNGELLAGRITETEAYVGRCDKACHAYFSSYKVNSAPESAAPASSVFIRQIFPFCLLFNNLSLSNTVPAL